jgi:hypothetical protein
MAVSMGFVPDLCLKAAVSGRHAAQTAGPSTALRSAQDDKS